TPRVADGRSRTSPAVAIPRAAQLSARSSPDGRATFVPMAQGSRRRRRTFRDERHGGLPLSQGTARRDLALPQRDRGSSRRAHRASVATVGNADYLELNRTNWDARAEVRAAHYGFEKFLEDPEHLSDVVRFDLPRLGDVAGL